MLAATGVIWAAVYMLWMLQRVVFGKVTNPANAKLPDLNAREIGLMLPLLILMLVMGVFPRPFMDRSKASVEAVLHGVAQESWGSSAGIRPARALDKSRDLSFNASEGVSSHQTDQSKNK
jgi:NADH-quinone oxidoreductase subunit M